LTGIEDKDRPPVLAHVRFQSDRTAFLGLDLAARFHRIYKTNLWGAVGSVSGLGSEKDATAHLRHDFPNLLRKLGARSLLDAPCGDGGPFVNIDLGMPYTGIDIVPELIAGLRSDAEKAASGRRYMCADITCDPVPRADAVLCRDCLVHLSFSHIMAAVSNFRRSGSEWLITTTFPKLGENVDCEDGDWRALNFELSPFQWGRPAFLLNEGCTEGEGGWADKSLAAWRTTALPPIA
jgi:SAM-dependent methyltransferase